MITVPPYITYIDCGFHISQFYLIKTWRLSTAEVLYKIAFPYYLGFT